MEELNVKVANTIIRQMGGAGRLSAMVNMKNPIAFDVEGCPALRFKFSGNRKINHCVVILNANDTYTMQLKKITAGRLNSKTLVRAEGKNKTIEEYEDIYFDMLKTCFESGTGLYLSL